MSLSLLGSSPKSAGKKGSKKSRTPEPEPEPEPEPTGPPPPKPGDEDWDFVDLPLDMVSLKPRRMIKDHDAFKHLSLILCGNT